MIDESLIQERFIRSSGPGGQNVNKVATAVELRLDVDRSGLPDDVKTRLKTLAGRRMTGDGVLVIDARAQRTQARNRADARARLFDLIDRASRAPRPRRATRPTAAARQRRLDTKHRRARTKKIRTKLEE